MSPWTIVALSLLLLLGERAAADDPANAAKEECRRNAAACNKDVLGEALPVCGSDGVTYANHCRLISRQCQGKPVLFKHTGPCPEAPPCISARLSARPNAKPSCRLDGTYAALQCHPETDYCWCVTPQGKPLPNTSVRGERPRCNKVVAAAASAAALSANNERSQQRKEAAASAETTSATTTGAARRRSASWKQRRQYSNRHRSPCSRDDKSRFNGNLIENFKIEFRRTNITADVDKNVDQVLAWKFASLDRDGDGYLDRAEYKELRRLAKKAVRPKKCARTFARACDMNQDLRLSLHEWSACLVNDFTLLKDKLTDKEHAYGEDAPEASDDTDANDCITDRRSVLEDQRQNSQENFYIPECTPDGRYHKVQCYSGYCWCVYQDTGKPIPGTSSKDQTPNCNPVPTPVRPMKGCPEAKKQAFLRDLMGLLQEKMKESSSDSDEATDKWQASKEERVATWHFVMLDKNKNKVLERKEWKSFRAMVANSRQLRRCGKKLPRYCDVNNDRRISMTEWLSCLNAQQRPATGADNTSTETASTLKSPRIGPNPLDTFLNDYD